MNNLLKIISALFPVVVLFIYIWYRDRRKPEPWIKIVCALCLGIISFSLTRLIISVWISLSYLPVFNCFFEQRFSAILFKSYYYAAIPEETVKLLLLWLLLKWNKDYDEYLDGIVYSVLIGLGFAAYENIMYIFIEKNSWQLTAFIRCIFSVPSHYLFAILMGFFYSLAKFREKFLGKYHIFTWLIPVFVHGVYDFICFYSGGNQSFLVITYTMLTLLCVLLHIVCLRYINKLEKIDMDDIHRQSLYLNNPYIE